MARKVVKSLSRYKKYSPYFYFAIVIAITQKPTQVDPRQGATLENNPIDAEEELKMLHTKLDALKSKPKKKFSYPQTAAQELGWDMDTDFNAHRPRYGMNKFSCPETQYANSYVTMTTKSPFAANRPNAEAAKK